MLNWLFKKSKLYKQLDGSNRTINSLLDESNKHNAELYKESQEEIEKLKTQLKTGGYMISEGNSSLLLEFDDDLQVTVSSRINDSIITSLIDREYIISTDTADEASVQFAFILVANEVTEQIIDRINEHEET